MIDLRKYLGMLVTVFSAGSSAYAQIPQTQILEINPSWFVGYWSAGPNCRRGIALFRSNGIAFAGGDSGPWSIERGNVLVTAIEGSTHEVTLEKIDESKVRLSRNNKSSVIWFRCRVDPALLTPDPRISQNFIFGRWSESKYSCDNPLYFRRDGETERQTRFGRQRGKWRLEGDILTITPSLGESPHTNFVTSMDQNSFRIVVEGESTYRPPVFYRCR